MTTLPDQLSCSWLRAPETIRLMTCLLRAGGPKSARFVGGCVRDGILGRKINCPDIDIATRLAPEAVLKALESCGIKAIATGFDHGTLTAVLAGFRFEITSLRQDVITDGRHAKVIFGVDWEEDAKRRDFRFNSLYADANGRIYDPTQHGIEDALAGKVVFIGDAATRIREDYLRAVRFFRLFAEFGKGAPDPCAMAAIAEAAHKLSHLSKPRISAEIFKLLAAKDPRPALEAMIKTVVLQVLLPNVTSLDVLNRLIHLDVTDTHDPDPILRLAAFFYKEKSGFQAKGFVSSPGFPIVLSRYQARRLIKILDDDRDLNLFFAQTVFDIKTMRRLIWRLGHQTFQDRARLYQALHYDGIDHISWRKMIAEAGAWPLPVFPVLGRDLRALGVPEGQNLGVLLKALENWWIDDGFPMDEALIRKQLLKLVKADI